MNLVSEKRKVEAKSGDCLRDRQIRNPSRNEHGTAQLEVLVQKSVHGDEDRELEKHRKTSAERTDAGFLVQSRSLLVELLRIVLVLCLKFLQLRLKSSHLGC